MRRAVIAACAAAIVAGAGCGGTGGGDASDEDLRGHDLTVWTNEFQPDRVRRTERILADFSKRTGVKVDLVPIPEDELAPRITEASTAGRLPDVVFATPVAESQSYADDEIFDTDAAQEVIDRLDPSTFSQKALELVSVDGKATGVPSDGWGQLLIYRKDLFDRAGISRPVTLPDVLSAARRLQRPGRSGIALATAPTETFTQESFEHIALAAGCRLVDAAGKVTFDSPPCVEALRYYRALAATSRTPADQGVDSTRRSYLAGRAAMLLWSPFILDAMAGLRDDTRPTCPQCRLDPAFLAKNSGLVGPLSKDGGQPSQFGSVSTFDITVEADTAAAQALVEFMMSDGYVRWLGLSPQGKFPLRSGDGDDPERFVQAWEDLESGVDRLAPLSDYYSPASITSLGDGAQRFERWGFAEGQGALVGALSRDQPVAKGVADVVAGKDPAAAAREVQAAVEELQAGLQ